MIFGKESDRGIKVDGWDLVETDAASAGDWDPTVHSSSPAFAMSMLDDNPNMPTPLGIFRQVEASVYEQSVNQQIATAIEQKGAGKLRDLVWSGETWDIG